MRLRPLKAREVISALQRAGYEMDRVHGSHHILVRVGNPTRTVPVPLHAGRDIHVGLLRAIIRQAGLTPREFLDLL